MALNTIIADVCIYRWPKIRRNSSPIIYIFFNIVGVCLFIDSQKSEEWRVTLKDRKSAKRVPPLGASAEQQKHEELSARGRFTGRSNFNYVKYMK